MPCECNSSSILRPPRFLFVEGPIVCNLKCDHCNLWKINIPASECLPTSSRLDIIDEFASMNQSGQVVTCGAESMLDLENYFAVSKRSHERGLRQLSVVNGTKIPNETMARKMIAEGPDEISISLDSHLEELHDKHRGVKGSFMVAIRALRLLLAARAELGRRDKRIYAMLLVYSENYLNLDAAYEFALNEVGVDKLKINMMQPTFAGQGQFDPFYDQYHMMDPELFRQHLMVCDSKFGLGYNPIWIDQMVMFLRSLRTETSHKVLERTAETIEPLCNASERNIIVTHMGVMKMCFSDRFKGVQYQTPGDLKRFWETSHDLRRQMAGCKDLCGVSHSMRKESCTLASRNRIALEIEAGH